MNLVKEVVIKCKFQNILVKTYFSTDTARFFFPKVESQAKSTSVVKEAEKVAGYTSSFLNLGWIFNIHIINVASHVQKVIGINHPLINTAKNLLLRDEQVTWGLIVLLLSKTAGLNFSELDFDKIADIFHRQRITAEVTEMIKVSHLIHKGLINIEPSTSNSSDLNLGNTLALLCGDYLLSTVFNEIARLRNFHVQETISSTLRDLAESEYLGLRDSQNQPLPSKPLPLQKNVNIASNSGVEPFHLDNIMGNMRAEWTLRNILSGGSLLGKGCQSMLILANHEPRVQEMGYNFGRSFALAWQASLEKEFLKNETFSLVCAPVMFHLEYDPGFYKEIEKGLSDIGNVNYDFVRRTVMTGPGLENTQKLQDEFAQTSLKILDSFSDSESKTALVNIIKSL